jgi:hypothetical protein
MIHAAHRRAAIATVFAVFAFSVFGLASAGAATKKPAAKCGAQPGTTVLEDAQGRVFTHHKLYYACALGSRTVTTLSGNASFINPGAGFELVGRYVIWSVDESYGVSPELELLDLDHGSAKTVLNDSEEGEATQVSLEDYALNADGTAIWLVDRGVCGPFGPCTSNSTVGASRGNSTLANVTTTSNDSELPPAPITSLGLSADGKLAFWIDQGQADYAQIP